MYLLLSGFVSLVYFYRIAPGLAWAQRPWKRFPHSRTTDWRLPQQDFVQGNYNLHQTNGLEKLSDPP